MNFTMRNGLLWSIICKSEITMKNMYQVKQVIVVRKDLNMRKGKLAAQVAHASNGFLIELLESRKNALPETREKLYHDWVSTGHTKVVVSCDSEKELQELIKLSMDSFIPCYPVTDFGLTEFHGVHTLTCAAFGPWKREELDRLTGHLKLI